MLKTRDEAKEIAKQYAEFLDNFITVDSCYLYGSYADSKKIPRQWSDIDVGVVSPDFSSIPFNVAGKILAKASAHICPLIEGVPISLEEMINPDEGTLPYIIINEGFKVY